MGLRTRPSSKIVSTRQNMKQTRILNGPRIYLRLLLSARFQLLDLGLLIVGVLSAIASGVPFPILGILFGQLIDGINSADCDNASGSQIDERQYQSEIDSKVLQVVYLAIANFVLIYIYIASWNLFGERLAQRLRRQYLSDLLHQDAKFFDSFSRGEVSARLESDIKTIQQGTSEKVGIVLNAVSFFVTAYVIAFIKDAKLGGELISMLPAFLFMTVVGGHYVAKFSSTASEAVSKASSLALEALSSILVVQAFGAEGRIELMFSKILGSAQNAGVRKAVATSVQSGLLFFIAYSASALAYWQGSRQIAQALGSDSGGQSVGSVYTVIFILVDATVILSSVAPFIQVFSAATASFEQLTKDMIPSMSPVQSLDDQAHEIEPMTLALRNVGFAYPSRPNEAVLQDVNLTFPVNTHTALVGVSGSGKSTIASLLLRMYEPSHGSIVFGETPLHEVSITNWRSRVSLLQQEALLFDRSILENVALGLACSTKHKQFHDILHDGTLETVVRQVRAGKDINEVVQTMSPSVADVVRLCKTAAQQADASAFVDSLQHKWATRTGSRGGQLSGGQRQRIALARALIKDPELLVLDEPTASLDSLSEQKIQKSLDHAGHGRTIITIAHRLSTIKDADNIVVMEHGRVAEQGTHAELLRQNNVYARMVSLQNHGDQSRQDKSSLLSVDNYADSDLDEKVSISKDVEQSHGMTLSDETIVGAQPPRTKTDNKCNLRDILRFLSPMVRRQALILLFAFVAVLVVGSTYSVSAVIFGNTLGALSPCKDVSQIRSNGAFYALMFFVLALVEFAANIVSWSGFGFVSERLLHRIRTISFQALLKQDLFWHQSAGRSPASLLSLITKDTVAIGALTGSTLGTMLSILVNLVVAVALTHALAWKIAIVCLSTVPLLLGAGVMQLIVISRFEAEHEKAFANSLSLATEAVEGIRIVTAYGLEDEMLQTYDRSLKEPVRQVTKHALYAKLWLALAYGLPAFVYALAYWWGATLVIRGEYSQVKFFIVLVALLVSAQLWGQLFTMAPDLSRARAALSRIIDTLNLDSKDNSFPTTEDKSSSLREKASLDPEKAAPSTDRSSPASPNRGGSSIVFKDVSFSYPSRPHIPVLTNFSMTTRPGQFCALVGPSGAGKSTIIMLLERMYFPSSGKILIDEFDINSTASTTFRDSIALVPQEPILFSGTVRFNISLGAATSSPEPTDDEIEQAARLANIHGVIAALPQGYDTECGPGGAAHFSGGQKQRLAIARALIRKPKLLLLDESTSALDVESERALQDGLMKVIEQQGMTVIAIAHRLGTIRRADVIFVMDEGRIVGQGRHEELVGSGHKGCELYRKIAGHQMIA